MKTTHAASATPTDYTREEIELLASASSTIRSAAHAARLHGLGFTLENPDTSSVVLTIQEPTTAAGYLKIVATRKSPNARPGHVVIHSYRGNMEKNLAPSMAQVMVHRMIERRDH